MFATWMCSGLRSWIQNIRARIDLFTLMNVRFTDPMPYICFIKLEEPTTCITFG